MSSNSALPDPDILLGLGEAFAAGYFELPEAPPLQRWARAVRRRFEHRAIPVYAGTRLFPAGPHTQARENVLLSPSYSFTWSYNAAALQQCIATADARTRATLLAMDRALGELQSQLDCIRTVHTIGGRGYTHSIPNYGRVLREGLSRYDDRIREKLAGASAAGDGERRSLCEGLLDVIAGIRAWHARLTAALAAAVCEEIAADTHRRRLLACLQQVPFRPARTFAEAVTAYNLVYYLDDCDNPGRVDQELIGFYRRDLAEGLITYEEAEACIHELWQNTANNAEWSRMLTNKLPIA